MRPAIALIDTAALKHNAAYAKSLAPSSRLVVVVKANAYGHGAVTVAKALQNQVDMFAVASLEEASDLKNAGIQTPILLLEGCFSADELPEVARLGLAMVVHHPQQLQWLGAEPDYLKLPIWLKVDTGMHRIGLLPGQLDAALEKLGPWQPNWVLMSHFASADEQQNPLNQKQLGTFADAVKQIQMHTGSRPQISLANSAALLSLAQSHGEWNRPGVMLYGISPFQQDVAAAKPLKPVMRLVSAITAIREIASGESVGYGNRWTATRKSRIATVAIGYGDGYPRTAKNGTPVWVNGQLAPLCGRVSMDMLSVDVTDLAQVSIGDEVELWGPNLPVNRVAECADTIGYELVTRMPRRVPLILV